jgi:hypothetical protein
VSVESTAETIVAAIAGRLTSGAPMFLASCCAIITSLMLRSLNLQQQQGTGRSAAAERPPRALNAGHAACTSQRSLVSTQNIDQVDRGSPRLRTFRTRLAQPQRDVSQPCKLLASLCTLPAAVADFQSSSLPCMAVSALSRGPSGELLLDAVDGLAVKGLLTVPRPQATGTSCFCFRLRTHNTSGNSDDAVVRACACHASKRHSVSFS